MLAVDLREINLLFIDSSPQAKLTEGMPTHPQASQFRARFLFNQRHVTIKRQDFSTQPFDGHLLDQAILVVDLKKLLGGIDHKRDMLASQSLLDIIGLLVDIDTAIRTDTTSKSMPMSALQPTIGIDLIRQRGELGERREGHTRRLILTRTSPLAAFHSCNDA
jgi:hypothetical protein